MDRGTDGVKNKGRDGGVDRGRDKGRGGGKDRGRIDGGIKRKKNFEVGD